VQQQHQRDQQDSTRKAAPLQIPTNAYVVDTTELSFDEVVQKVEDYVRSTLKST
jgi:cytidylate kinase